MHHAAKLHKHHERRPLLGPHPRPAPGSRHRRALVMDSAPSTPNGRPRSADGAVTAEQVHQYFAPYRRLSPPWDAYEILKTGLITIFVLPFRILYLLCSSAVLLLIASIAMTGVKPSQAGHSDPASDGKPSNAFDDDPLFQPPPLWRKLLISLLFPICRSILFVSFGVYYVSRDKKPFSYKPPRPASSPPAKAYVIVANHLGYIDILVLLSTFRGSFVAKGELENAVIVGRLARALQCMFVRKGESLTAQLINRVQSTYECHLERETCPSCPACMSKLVIFAEGTTSNGTAMIPFRTGVFNAGLPVKPVCIQFPYRHFNLSWESIRFREHMFRTMTQFRNYVHCTELPVYEPSEEEKLDARLYAYNIQKEMATALNVPVVPLNRRHKFLYHGFLLGKEPDLAELLRKAEEITKEDEQLLFFKSRKVEELL